MQRSDNLQILYFIKKISFSTAHQKKLCDSGNPGHYDSGTLRFSSFFLSGTLFYRLIFIKISMNRNRV
jgi:hypothetical protein